MFEDIRRGISHRREAKEKERLRKIELKRRLSHLKMKRLEERKTAEESLREQAGAELVAQQAATKALKERKQMERELRGPSIVRRVVRLPGKAARIGTKLSKGPGWRKILIGDTSLLLGKPKQVTGQKPKAQESMHDFLYGKPTKPEDKPKDKDIDILS